MDSRGVKVELSMALGCVYRIRMGTSIKRLPSEEWAMRVHAVEQELVALSAELKAFTEKGN